jgi:hypothetical protein
LVVLLDLLRCNDPVAGAGPASYFANLFAVRSAVVIPRYPVRGGVRYRRAGLGPHTAN